MLTTLFGFLMLAGFTACYLPQIYKLHNTKSSNDISIGQYFLTIVGYLFGLFYIVSQGVFAVWLMINYLSGILFCIWIIYLCHKYKK